MLEYEADPQNEISVIPLLGETLRFGEVFRFSKNPTFLKWQPRPWLTNEDGSPNISYRPEMDEFLPSTADCNEILRFWGLQEYVINIVVAKLNEKYPEESSRPKGQAGTSYRPFYHWPLTISLSTIYIAYIKDTYPEIFSVKRAYEAPGPTWGDYYQAGLKVGLHPEHAAKIGIHPQDCQFEESQQGQNRETLGSRALSQVMHWRNELLQLWFERRVYREDHASDSAPS